MGLGFMLQSCQRINNIYIFLKKIKKEFQASLGYQVNSRPTLAIKSNVLQNK